MTTVITTLLLLLVTPTQGFLQRKPILPRPSISRTTEFRVARAETRTTASTRFQDDKTTFRKLCELLCPEQSKLLKLDESHDGLRGVYTTRNIAAGDVILSVPLESCLRDDDIPFWMEQSTLEEDIAETNSYTASSWAKRLAASLIDLQLDAMESTADETGELWLSLLPDPSHLRATLPIHWSEDVITSAHCSALELAVDSAFFARAEAVDDLLLQLLAGCKAAQYLSQDSVRTMAENALDIVQTRTCRVETLNDGTPLRLLAPLFDMLNHRNLPNAAFQVETMKSMDNEAYDALVVRATQDISANSEVFISYGASTKPSWRCLASYGFVPAYDPTEPEYEDQDEDMTHSAEVFLEGMRYEVGPGSISQDIVDAMQECIDPTLSKPAMLTPQVALRLAQRISEAAFQMLLDDSGTKSMDTLSNSDNAAAVNDHDDDEDDDVHMEHEWSLTHVISARQAAALRWNQHRILMACSLGLRDWVAAQSTGSNM